MVNADKLVETLNQALQKAGGEATRVWPDMVAAWRVQSAVNLVECLVLLAAALLLRARLPRVRRRAHVVR